MVNLQPGAVRGLHKVHALTGGKLATKCCAYPDIRLCVLSIVVSLQSGHARVLHTGLDMLSTAVKCQPGDVRILHVCLCMLLRAANWQLGAVRILTLGCAASQWQ